MCYAVVTEGQEFVDFYSLWSGEYRLGSDTRCLILVGYFLRSVAAQQLVAYGVDLNVHFEGRVVSIPFRMASGRAATTGLVQTGEYEFTNQHPECIIITSGTAKINDVELAVGDYINVEANAGVKFEAVEGPVTYLCIYG